MRVETYFLLSKTEMHVITYPIRNTLYNKHSPGQ